jgi:hypothetical protein
MHDDPDLRVSGTIVAIEKQFCFSAKLFAVQVGLMTAAAMLNKMGRDLTTITVNPSAKLTVFQGRVVGKISKAKSGHARNKFLAVNHTKSLLLQYPGDPEAVRLLAQFDGAGPKKDDLADSFLQALACIAEMSLTDEERNARDFAKVAAKDAKKAQKQAANAVAAAERKATRDAERTVLKLAAKEVAKAERLAQKEARRVDSAASKQAAKRQRTE